MKPSLLIISMLQRSPSFDTVFDYLEKHFLVKLIKLKVSKEDSLSAILTEHNANSYDYILLDLPHYFLRNNCSTIKLNALKITIYEEDACQNFMPDSRWFGDFLHTYKKIGRTKIINTGHHVSAQLKSRGVNSTFIAKGYDQKTIENLEISREIPLAFIGTYRSNTYHERYKYIRHLELFAGLQSLRTNPGKEYNDTLNKISCFFSADCGIGEYMAKNFEAMAAGCLLLAYRQGNGEEQALGLEDGVNVLLYSSPAEAVSKAKWIDSNPQQAEAIAMAGLTLAQQQFCYDNLGEKLAKAIIQ